jgi:hypothetical protein
VDDVSPFQLSARSLQLSKHENEDPRCCPADGRDRLEA